MEQSIVEGNKLIAEFMEATYYDAERLWVYNIASPPDKNVHSHSYTQWETNELKYSTSWNWLMPVVEKISEKCRENNSELYREFYNGKREELLIFRFPKEKTWQLSIDFINFYNETIKTKP